MIILSRLRSPTQGSAKCELAAGLQRRNQGSERRSGIEAELGIGPQAHLAPQRAPPHLGGCFCPVLALFCLREMSLFLFLPPGPHPASRPQARLSASPGRRPWLRPGRLASSLSPPTRHSRGSCPSGVEATLSPGNEDPVFALYRCYRAGPPRTNDCSPWAPIAPSTDWKTSAQQHLVCR